MAQPAGPAAANPYAAPQSAPSPERAQGKPVSKAVLLLLTLFFGGIGAHKFYLGKWWQGALSLVFFWTALPALVALVEFLVYCFTSEARLNEKYSAHGVAALVVVVCGVLFGLLLLGILAAIAIPAYADFSARARVVDAIHSANPWRAAVDEHYARHKQLPDAAGALEPGLVPQDPPARHSRIALGPGGTITLTFLPSAGALAGKTIVIRPYVDGPRMTWDCAGGSVEPRYRPRACRPPG